MNIKTVGLLATLLIPLTGCSEEYGSGADQEIYVHTSPEGAHCSLINKRGGWEIFNTPERINVTRGREALDVKCSNYKGWAGQARIGANGSVEGVADAVGSIQIDAIDSVFMKYPNEIVVKLSPPVHDTTGGYNLGGISEMSLEAIQRKREAEMEAMNPPPPIAKKAPEKRKSQPKKSHRKPIKTNDDCLPLGMRAAK
ncbi:hypothetical protein AA14337_3275 [Acetobacter malorum DSM 14337]|uniref:Lipoprotein n=1 Tax=Acetobacter malorum DSM 14337 TaxID=1307910 RepID=A0ABQ0Q0M3_9PROT|nr:hypothetical protein [Acetobacter malorum]KXV06440.1 hypothetical protein AD930_07430 [Acetobacter malorum]GBQ86259.1 hypothetical protein AA14337_3275 [Acetobacter malorum DSM 14337]